MDIPVLIEPVAGNGYRAKCGEPLPITAEGKTRDEAIANLRRLVEQRVAAGAEVAALRLRGDCAANPWVEFAGMYDPDDPVVRDWEKAMAEHRRKIDEHPERP
jgi:predicted RNase H-like HicB family nuclease